MAGIEATLRAIIAEVAEIDDAAAIPADATLRSLGINSMRGLEVLMLVEERLGIHVPEQALYDIETLADVLAYATQPTMRSNT